MREFVDLMTGERLGVEYTSDEHETALVATQAYLHELAEGTISDDPEVVADGVEVCGKLNATLEDGNPVIDPKTHEVLRTLPIAFLGRIQRTLRPEKYGEISERFGMTVFQLAYYGMIASCMMDDQGIELVPILKDPQQGSL